MPLINVEEYSSDWISDLTDCHVVFAIGYESRSRFIASQILNPERSALGLRFGNHEVESFDENLKWAQSKENIQIRMADTESNARAVLRNWLRAVVGAEVAVRVVVDVSSLSRLLIAIVISELSRVEGDIEVVFVYTPAEFSPDVFDGGSFVQFGAVTEDFGGIPDVGKHRLAVVISLGYEQELALATQQFLDPKESWLFIPVGHDERYDLEVERSNTEVIRLAEGNAIEYSLMKPFEGFVNLESLVSGLVQDSNVVLVPFGPKLFAVVMMLVGLLHPSDVGVWRVSAEQYSRVKDRIASGEIAGIVAMFGASRITDK